MNNLKLEDIKDNLLNKLSLASSLMLGINIFNLIFVFCLHITLTRHMGAENYGGYYFTITLITILSIFTKAGADTLLIRYLPKYVSENCFELVKGVMTYITKRTAIYCFFVVVISILIINILNYYYDNFNKTEYYYGLLLLPCLSFLHITQAKLTGFKLVIKSQVPERVIFPLFFVLSVLIISDLGETILTAREALVLHVSGIVISFILAKYLLSNHIKDKFVTVKEKYNKTAWKNSSRSLIFIAASYMIMNQIDILMVGVLIDKEQSGIYGVAARIAILVAYGLHATNLVLAPYVSKLYTEDRITNLKLILQKTAKYNLMLSTILCTAILIFSSEILSVFGDGFVNGRAVLMILCFGQIINVMAGSTGVLMTMSGNEYTAARIMFVAVVLNIILNILLIPRMGMEGAAVATATATVFWNALMLIYSCKRIGINTSAIKIS